MKITKILLILPLLTTLACKSNSSSDWSCRNLDSKVGCANISKSDDAYLENSNNDNIATTAFVTNGSNNPNKNSSKKYNSFEDINLGQTRLVRTPEKIGRIWIAPYMDNKGNYHEASFVRIVDAESKWEKVAEISEPVVNIPDAITQENSISKPTTTTLTSATTTKNHNQPSPIPLAKSNDEGQQVLVDEEDSQEFDDVKEINLNQPAK
jgi:type IV conjugative transfer system lipoprotein TraV